jgi:hypothetical protein
LILQTRRARKKAQCGRRVASIQTADLDLTPAELNVEI